MIKLRFDVDYPYPSRLQSFIFTALNLHSDRNFDKYAKTIAKMVNESTEEVKTHWFFTPYTIPDKELLELLHPEKHEVALHVATNPYREWKRLEEATGRKVQYYTVHGTARLLARIIWKRKPWQPKAPIPQDFPLKSFYDFPTIHLDTICHKNHTDKAVEIARESIAKGEVLHAHPEWLLQRGTFNHRGPYYETLKTLLNVDAELNQLVIRKKRFAKVAEAPEHLAYLHDADISGKFLEKLVDRDADLFTFIDRKWCCPVANPASDWRKIEDNVALLTIVPYEEWLNAVGKKTRNMIRKAEKSGVKVEAVSYSEVFAEGVWKIYNETPIRQDRAFSHYGWTLETTKTMLSYYARESTYVGAYLNGELIGFVLLTHGDQIAVMAQILSSQKHWDKSVNNALVAKAVEVCAQKNVPWLMYGRMGNHPSLDAFKENNGFSKCAVSRYYVPLTRKGRIIASLGLHKELKETLPEWLKGPLIPLYNWISRARIQIRGKT